MFADAFEEWLEAANAALAKPGCVIILIVLVDLQARVFVSFSLALFVVFLFPNKDLHDGCVGWSFVFCWILLRWLRLAVAFVLFIQALFVFLGLVRRPMDTHTRTDS